MEVFNSSKIQLIMVGPCISLTKGSIIKTDDKLTIDIDLNFATNYGGGIYVDDAGLWEKTSYHNCFIQPRMSTNCTISFEGNEAELAGSALFGGSTVGLISVFHKT
jgi:hypothetical protein